MNLNSNPDIEELKKIISLCDDNSTHHIIWVSKGGDVNVTPLPEEHSPVTWHNENVSTIKFRLETCSRGQGYVGEEASQDVRWMGEVYKDLTENWAKGTTGYGEEG